MESLFKLKSIVSLFLIIWAIPSFAQNDDFIEVQRNQNGRINFVRFTSDVKRELADGPNILQKVLEVKPEHEFRLGNQCRLPQCAWRFQK
jgi:hypothetical protein